MHPDTAPVLPPDVSADDAEILWTSTGRPFVRTPDECFANLPDYPWEPNYAEVDGMRMHYVDTGDPNGEVVLLLHGQPDSSYLYRKMIPVLADAGFRVIAPDHIGFGKSDKPVQLADYRFLQHVAWIEEFIDVVGLDAITPVVQDWGSLIGLRAVGNRPDTFARIVVANGNLLVLPEGMKVLNLPDSLEPQDLEFPDVVSPGGGMQRFDDQIAGAAGQPHCDFPDAGHMIQEDAGAELAAHIAAWMRDTPPTTA